MLRVVIDTNVVVSAIVWGGKPRELGKRFGTFAFLSVDLSVENSYFVDYFLNSSNNICNPSVKLMLALKLRFSAALAGSP